MSLRSIEDAQGTREQQQVLPTDNQAMNQALIQSDSPNYNSQMGQGMQGRGSGSSTPGSKERKFKKQNDKDLLLDEQASYEPPTQQFDKL